MYEKLDKLEEPIIENDESIYEDKGRENLLDSDAIDAEEAGFMQGYEEEDLAICNFCKKPLTSTEDIVENIVNNKTNKFCSEVCLKEFEENM